MIVKVLRQKAVGCVCVSCQSPSRATACQAGVNKNQSNQQRSLLSRSDTAEGWQQRFICSVFSFTWVLQWWLPLIIALPPPSKVIHQFITKIWDYTVLFYVVTKLLVKLAWGPLTWWYLHAGLMVYLSDCRLLPSVRGTSYPQSHMILQLATQSLITEDKGSSQSLPMHYFCHFTYHQT